MSANALGVGSIPLEVRIRLSHAYFQYFANKNKVDLLHIKGYAFGEETYREGRQSSDVDLLVRPAHVQRFLWLLKQDGWKIVTTFESGSIFEHAATIYHPSWGLCDIHRYFPGLGFSDPVRAFNQLWEARRYKEIAHFSCLVPNRLDALILVVMHAARAKEKISHPDISYLREKLDAATWEDMRVRALELDAEMAFDAALGRLEEYRDNRYYLMWKVASEDLPSYLEWQARINRAQGTRNKLRVMRQIFSVNKDHLAMELGHEPSQAELRDKFFSRFKTFKRKEK